MPASQGLSGADDDTVFLLIVDTYTNLAKVSLGVDAGLAKVSLGVDAS